MKLLYLTPLTFPSRYANRVQVLKMTAAFAHTADATLAVARLNEPLDAVRNMYGVSAAFTVSEVGLARFYPRSMAQAWRLRRVVRQAEQGTVFYARDVLMVLWLSFFSRRFRNNYFFELHTLTRFPKWVYRHVLTHARGIITTNERKKDDMMRIFGIETNRILVRGNGVDLAEFDALPAKEEARRILDISTSGPLVVYAGTMAEYYGSRVIEETRQLLASDAEIQVVSGEARARALLYMAAADILIAPYLSANDHFRYYMSPMKVKEYMTTGRPIVVSDLPAIREIVDDRAAWLVAPGDARALADAIRFIMAHPKEGEARAHEARMRVEQVTWDMRAQDIIHFMETHHGK